MKREAADLLVEIFCVASACQIGPLVGTELRA
jgi:hypothetical protein